MDYQFFKLAGAVAGIGGLALGAVVFIFREVIRKEIFPRLTKAQAYSLLNRIVILIFVIGVLGIAAYLLINWRNQNDRYSLGGSQAPTPAPSVPAPQVSGIVVDKRRHGLQGALVTIKEIPGMTPVTTSTDGVFNLIQIPRYRGDRVRLRVVMEGYLPNPYEEDVVLGLGDPSPEIILTKK